METAQTIQDIAYAVVLISIIVCSIMVAFISNEKDDTTIVNNDLSSKES